MSPLPQPSTTDRPRAARILILHGDAAWRIRAARVLRAAGWVVDALDPNQGRPDGIDRFMPDCVVVDGEMAGPAGASIEATCKALRAQARHAKTPILWLAERVDTCAWARARQCQASDLCPRATDAQTLVQRIDQLMQWSGPARERHTLGGPLLERALPSGPFQWCPETGEVHGSEAFFRLLGMPVPHTEGRMRADVLMSGLTPRDRRRVAARLRHLIEGGPQRRLEIAHWAAPIGHRRLGIEIRQVHREGGGGRIVTGQLVDVTPQVTTSDRLYRLTRYDTLTGLPNRQWLLEVLRDRLRRGASGMALVLLAIDRFQEVSQAYGHQAAEMVVVEVARRLQALIRAPRASERTERGTLQDVPGSVATAASRGARSRVWIASVVYLGRDEFALVLEDLDASDAGLGVGRQVMHVFAEPFQVARRELFLRCSMGIEAAPTGDAVPAGAAVHPVDAVPLASSAAGDHEQEGAAAWIERAEFARRAAARAGGPRVRAFERRPAEDWAERLRLERDLQHALERGELALHLQPKVDARSGRTVGFEGLMRWTRAGVVQAPSRFIPLAEEMGLIIPLGEWAIAQACECIALLRSMGRPDCTLAVNLSPHQLNSTRLTAVVAEALERFAVPPGRLELELTESALMHDAERAIRDLSAIRELGVGLALDDFGTGYSSLAYLTRLPLSTLKIDRAFVQGLDASEPSQAVAAAVMTLGARLGLQVIAEGVERQAQRQALLQLGCTLQQGFLYGPARPRQEALDLLADEEPTQVDEPRRRGHRPAISTSTATMANPLESGL
jgi:predicted signal transduction protein with EAL and GGDEF domain